jgi:hypothetical protein
MSIKFKKITDEGMQERKLKVTRERDGVTFQFFVKRKEMIKCVLKLPIVASYDSWRRLQSRL